RVSKLTRSLVSVMRGSSLASYSFGFEIKRGQQDVIAGLKLQISAQKDGAITTTDHSSTNFSVQNARIYFMGKLNKIVEFGANFDFSDNTTIPPDGTARAHTSMHQTVVKDAYINLRFSKAFNIMTGLFMNLTLVYL
ncbi:MAG: porin, partial [Hydrogenobaculum sp.]